VAYVAIVWLEMDVTATLSHGFEVMDFVK